MGISFSCPGSDYDALDEGFDTVIVRAISFNGDDVKAALRSLSFNGLDSEPPAILKSLASRKLVIQGSLSFKRREMETMISIKTPSSDLDNNVTVKSINFKNNDITDPFRRPCERISSFSPAIESGIPKHDAALKLQKVYKSFRTRRKLADCAVLVEQRWWKLLDFAELKRSSISFFDIEKHETAVSRWSRARTRAAKVGKGLSKDEKAQKLALQHWLEAIDPRHRYGHNLHFYYITWLRCESRQPFFYWLDIGDGREVNLVDKCPRSRLQQQCIKYLGPIERKAYEVIVENGKFLYKHSGNVLDTSEGPEDAKWIFVLSTSKTLYVGQKKKGTFQHSSFLAGGATSAAGRLVVENGVLQAVWPHSGHYHPTEENFQEFVSFLVEHNVDLTNVKKSPTDEIEESLSKHGGEFGLRSNVSDPDLSQSSTDGDSENTNAEEELTHDGTEPDDQNTNDEHSQQPKSSKRVLRFRQKLANLEIPKRPDDLFEIAETDGLLSIGPYCNHLSKASPFSGYETADKSLGSEEEKEVYVVPRRYLFAEEQEGDEEEIIPEELIARRINSKKGMTSYQLGKQLSCRWTTGAGPRIGCVRDYPSELQFRVLEQVNLSPRSGGPSRSASYYSPKLPTPSTSSLRRGPTRSAESNFR